MSKGVALRGKWKKESSLPLEQALQNVPPASENDPKNVKCS